ncbi:hypothetical protein BASA81_000009 [Batrachochytrium salamandrivorans]|nr:hypothetical protein BASA81_000009 [Batrachochytrium salamandrivorans]
MQSLIDRFGSLSSTTGDGGGVRQALYDFVPQANQEMELKRGDLVQVVQDVGNGWTKVIKKATGKTGLVPTSYIGPAPRPCPPAPQPSAPPLAALSNAQTLANEHNECSICCEEMPLLPSGVLLDKQGKRICRHYLHVKCAEMLINSGHNNCPTCRARFDSLQPVPNLETDARRWFQTVDFDGNGKLSKFEVLDLVKTFLGGMEVSKLEQEFDLFWRRWDRNGDGEISFSELCDPKSGLMADFKHKFQRPTGSNQLGESPKLSVGTMRQWFEYWDQDGNGSLDKDEVIRALIKTFSLSSDLYKVNELRDTVNNIWGAFDFDGSGEISQQEFVQREVGLGESLVASLSLS